MIADANKLFSKVGYLVRACVRARVSEELDAEGVQGFIRFTLVFHPQYDTSNSGKISLGTLAAIILQLEREHKASTPHPLLDAWILCTMIIGYFVDPLILSTTHRPRVQLAMVSDRNKCASHLDAIFNKLQSDSQRANSGPLASVNRDQFKVRDRSYFISCLLRYCVEAYIALYAFDTSLTSCLRARQNINSPC